MPPLTDWATPRAPAPGQTIPRVIPIRDTNTMLLNRVAQLEDQLEQERNENRDLRELARGLQNVINVNNKINAHLRTKLDGRRS
jgi:hypothetical protein